jgi:hypothetical protein
MGCSSLPHTPLDEVLEQHLHLVFVHSALILSADI